MQVVNNPQNIEIFQAALFFMGLMLSFISALIVIVFNAPPLIVGTELNTNGLVEYLCLGNGCEDLQDMDW